MDSNNRSSLLQCFWTAPGPEGDYAAVIPKWIAALINRESIFLNGNGDTSRDFIFVPDAVQANLLAATAAKPEAVNQVYNVALNKRTTLIELFSILKALKHYLGT